MPLLRHFTRLFLACCFALPAAAQTFDATTRGSYSHAGAHNGASLNAYAGQGAGTDRHRAYMVFDLTALSRPIESGVLRLEYDSIVGPDAAEVFSVYDVTSNLDDLMLTQTNRADIYADLGTGVYYGVSAAFASGAGTILEIPLEPDAITDINNAAGQRFAVGVFVETVRLPVGSEGVRFALNGEPRVHQLVLTEAAVLPSSLSLDPSVAAMVPPASHTVAAHLADQGGAPVVGAPIDFMVVSGPNTGASASVMTDESGAASFSVSSDIAGVDRVLASHTGANGAVIEAEAAAFWDADCDGNQVPDSCDLACESFGGACAEFAACGAGVDANADGQLDACVAANAAPDCSQAAVVPGMFRRPDLKLHRISVGGVSDPDGDPVAVSIDSVFQDEPVDLFACGVDRPDATGLGTDQVSVRAESLPQGDGRVYHVAFSASDGRGGSCSGTATVCVPRMGWRKSDSCVDQGPRYDSTLSPARHRGHRGWRWHGRD